MNTTQEIQRALANLSLMDREHMLTWLSESLDENCVREAAASYEPEPERHGLSFEEYLAFEETSPIRHEYIAGALFAMSGASENHEFVAGNLFAAIHTHLRGRPCRPYKGDFKVRLQNNDKEIGYYPDVMVGCTRDGVEKNFMRYPVLIVEVLSPSTRAIDRREKRLNYTQIPTVQEYIIASQDAPELIMFRRANDWIARRITGLNSSIELASIDLSLPLARVFENLSFTANRELTGN